MPTPSARRRSAPTDVGEVLIEAAGELSAVADGHELHVDADHVIVDGARDELHRLALNLMENAVRHTPPGTTIRAGVERENGERRSSPSRTTAPASTRSCATASSSASCAARATAAARSGLGLSIVRAVAESHGGTVRVESPTTTGASIARGTRFVVTLPAATREPAATA